MSDNNNLNTTATNEKIEAERTETIMNFDDLDDGSDPNADLDLRIDTMYTMKMGSNPTISESDIKDLGVHESARSLDQNLLPSLSWIKEFLYEEMSTISPTHLECLAHLEEDQPKLWSAILHLVHELILEDLGLDVAEHPEFEKKFKGYLIKLELEINCNQLPTIYYFEDKTLTTYAWALMDLDFVDQKEIEGYVFFKHLTDEPSLDIDQDIDTDTEQDQYLFSTRPNGLEHTKFHKNLEKSLKQASAHRKNPLVKEALSNFQEKQKKLEKISENESFAKFMGFDDDGNDEKGESDILFMEIAVLLSQKVLFNIQRLIISILN